MLHEETATEPHLPHAPQGGAKHSPFSWTKRQWQPQHSLVYGANFGKLEIIDSKVCWICGMREIWCRKRNMKPISCRIPMYKLISLNNTNVQLRFLRAPWAQRGPATQASILHAQPQLTIYGTRLPTTFEFVLYWALKVKWEITIILHKNKIKNFSFIEALLNF